MKEEAAAAVNNDVACVVNGKHKKLFPSQQSNNIQAHLSIRDLREVKKASPPR